jgi:membrane fusion protein (multidrug efflux system)
VLFLAGCEEAPQAEATGPKTLPSVVVQTVASQDVSTSIEYVGRTEASQEVEVRARVSGVLLERPFSEGRNVGEGDLLYFIDPAEFEANVALAKAEVAKADASVEETETNLGRYEELLKRQAASQAKFDEAKAKYQTAVAQREAAKAQLQKANLDLDYTMIISPLAGRSGVSTVDAGNLIGPDSGTLVTIVRLDPIHVIFSISERDYLRYVERGRTTGNRAVTPKIRLADDRVYEHTGELDLIDNKVDPATGTINIRVQFPNPEEELFPGQFVNVLLVEAEPQARITVPQAAVQENQSGAFVLVVDEQNKVVSKPIARGQTVGESFIVEEGLSAGERIIVEGIQKVRPGAEVTPVERGASS